MPIDVEARLRKLAKEYEDRRIDLRDLEDRTLLQYEDLRLDTKSLQQGKKQAMMSANSWVRAQDQSIKISDEVGVDLRSEHARITALDTKLSRTRGSMSISTDSSGAKFWAKYDQLLEDGKFDKAEKILRKGPGWIQGRKWFWGCSKAEWRADLGAAQKNLETFRANFEAREEACAVVEAGETALAGGIRKLTKDKKFMKSLRHVSPGDPAMTAELAMLRDYAIVGKPSLKQVIANLDAFKGGFNMDNVTAGLKTLEYDAARNLHAVRSDLKVNQDRQAVSKKLASSIAVTRKMETQYSVSQRAVNMEKTIHKTLAGLDVSNPASVVAAEKIATRAENKQTRWSTVSDLEDLVDMVEKPNFNPKNVKKLPGKSYAGRSLKDMNITAKAAFASATMATVHGGQRAAAAVKTKTNEATYRVISGYQGFKHIAETEGTAKAFRDVATDKMHIPEGAVNALSTATNKVGGWLKKGGHMIGQALDDMQVSLHLKKAPGTI